MLQQQVVGILLGLQMISCIAFPRKISLRGGLLGSTAISCGLAMIFVASLATPLAADNLTWDSNPGTGGIQSGAGNWAEGPGSNENWQNAGGNNTNFEDLDDVSFSAVGGGTITLQEDVAPASITFDVGGYTIDSADAEHQIDVQGAATVIDVVGGSATIEAGISNKSTVAITGAGSLTLSGTNTDEDSAEAGTYDIYGGNLVITGSTAAEDVVENNNGTLLIDGGGTVLGTVTNNSGTFTNADGDVEGKTTVEGGDVNATGGTFTGGVQLNNGTMTIQADTSAGGISVATGTLEIEDGNTLDSGVAMTGNGVIDNVGTVDGNVILSDGEFRNGDVSGFDIGAVEGTVTLSGSGAEFVNNQGSAVNGLVTVNDGELSASGGSFADILVDGGTMAVSNDTQANVVRIESGNLDILAGQELDATLNVAGGEVENFGTMNGTVTLDDDDSDPATGGTLIGRGGDFEDVVVNDGTFDVEADTQADNVTNAGGEVLIETGGVTLTADFNQTGGETRVAAGGTLTDTDGLVTISGGELQNNGGGTVTSDVAVSGGTLTASGGSFGGNVSISGTGTFNLDGSATVGIITMTGGDIDINGSYTLTTDLEQSGGTTTVDFDGRLVDTSGTVDLSGGTLINQGTVADDIELTGDATLVADGGVFDGDITMLSVDTVFDVNASTIIAAPVTVTNGTVNINGTSTLTNNIDLGNGTVNVGADATLNDADGMNLVAGTLANAGTVTGQVTVSDGGSLDIAGGTFTNGVLANGGNILISEDTALDLTNNGSDIVIESGDTLTDDVVNNSGTLTSAGTIAGTLQITGGTVTQNEADLGDPVGGVTGAVTVSGTGQMIANSGEFGAGITAQADGDVEIGGPVSGDVTNDGGTVTITGTGDLDGDLTNEDGDTEIQANGQLDGDLIVNGGSVTTDGTVTGTGGGVGAVVLNGGTLTTTGNSEIQDTTTVSGGTLQADGGSFGGDGIDADDGNVNINGVVTGDVSIGATAALSVTGTGNLNGDVTMEATSTVEATNDGVIGGAVFANGGTFQNNGTISGSGASNSVAVSGGDFSNNSGGEIGTSVQVTDGTFFANGGSVTGDTLVTDTGQFVLTANSAGNVVNGTTDGGAPTGGTVTITGGLTLDGDVTNNSGITNVGGTINGALNVNGGTVTTAVDSAVTGRTTVNDGTLTANGGTFGEGILATGGNTNVDGEITITTGALTSGDGAVTIATSGIVNGNVATNNDNGGAANASIENSGTITGTVTVDGGEVTNLGEMQSGFTVNDGELSLEGTGSITGAGTVNDDGTFSASGGTFDIVTNDGGAVNVTGAVEGDVNNDAGTFTLGTLGGATGTLTGDLVNRGIANLNGTLDGETLNTGSNAEMTVALGDEANFGSTSLTNTNGATLTIAGNASGTITNTSTGVFELTGGTLTTGTIVNNAGQMTVTGNSTVTGTLNNIAGGTVDIAAGSVLTATTFENAADGTVELRGQLGSAISNSGDLLYFGTSILDDPDTDLIDETVIDPADANRFGGQVTNNATGNIILQTGRMTFGNGLVNNGTVDASSGQAGGPQVGDVVEVNGGLSGDGRFVLDIDLSENDVAPDGTGASDYVEVSGGPVTGTITLSFNLLASGAQPDNAVLVFSVAPNVGNDFTVREEGLPSGGEAVIYLLTTDGSGNYFVDNVLNPGIGSLAGSIVLTQSLIGSVINRPSSPFVSGLAYDDPDPCGAGVWTRAIGGEADSSGQITELDGSNNSFKGEISADFQGIQGGGDLACFNGYFKGWDISVGGIGGFNSGSTSQPVFELAQAPDGGLERSGELSSITDVDFDQTYAGVYVTGAFNRFSADLQYRLEQTDFVANNIGQNGSSGLGLTDETFSSEAATFSGSVSYAIPLGESSVTFVPTGGFAYTQVSTDAIDFDDGSSVQVEDFTSETVFVGGTLARTSFSEDGTSALSQFGTVTYYSDLADAPRSVFTPAPAADPTEQQPSRSLETENLGSYAELSAGLNYIRILPLDAPGGAKQLSASLRGDLRSSDQLDSWGVTGQFRIQF